MERVRLQYGVPQPVKRLTDLLSEYVDAGQHQPGEILLAAVVRMIPAVDLSPGVRALVAELLQELQPDLQAKASSRTNVGDYIKNALDEMAKAQEGQK